MTFSPDLIAGDEVEWERLLADDVIDPVLRADHRPSLSENRTTTGAILPPSLPNIETTSRFARNDLTVPGQANNVLRSGAGRYWQPQAAGRWRAGPGLTRSEQDIASKNNFNNASSSAIPPYLFPGMPSLPLVEQRQPSTMSHSGQQPTWMGRDYDQDGSMRAADLGAVPALRRIGTSRFQIPQTQQAPMPVYSIQGTIPRGLTPSHSQCLSYAATRVQGSGGSAPNESFRLPAHMQASGGFENPGISRPPTGYESQANSQFFGETLTASAIHSNSPTPLSTMPQALTVNSAAAPVTGAVHLTMPDSTRSSTTRRRGSGGPAKEFENYPSSSQPLPAGLSRQQICQGYPNHLKGENMLRVHYGQGNEQGLWNGHKIWSECPADGRHNGKFRPHNYMEHKVARAKRDASGGIQAEQRPGGTKRRHENSDPNDVVEQDQLGPALKRARPAEGAGGNVPHGYQSVVSDIVSHSGHYPYMPSAREETSNALVNALGHRTALQSPEEAAEIQNYGSLGPKNLRSDQLSRPDLAAPIDIRHSALLQSQESRLPVPTAGASRKLQAGQSAPLRSMDLFIANFKDETRFQHQIIWEQLTLDPRTNAWSEDAKRAHSREIWKNRFHQWESSIEQKYGVQAEKTVEGRTNPLDLLIKVCRKVTPPGSLDEESFRQCIAKAREISMEKFLNDLRWWRTDFVRGFEDGLTMINAMPATALGHKDDFTDDAAIEVGNGPSELVTDQSGLPSETGLTVKARAQDFGGGASLGRDLLQPAQLEQPYVVNVSESDRSARVQQDPEIPTVENPLPETEANPLELAHQVDPQQPRSEPGMQDPLSPTDYNDELADLFEDAADETAETTNGASASQQAIEQTEAAEPDTDDEAAALEEMVEQDDDDQEPVPMMFPSDDALLGQKAPQGRAFDDSISSATPEPAKRSRKPRARRKPQRNARAAAASARPVPSAAEMEAEAAWRAEMEEEALRKAEELGADRAWLKTQKIRSQDGREWPITASDIPLWVASYLGNGMPETLNNAKAAVEWHKMGCPGIKTEHTENAKQRRQREKREKHEKREENERQAKLGAEREGD